MTQKTTTAEKKTSVKRTVKKKPMLFETAWEACNQVGGIYTVIRSKVKATVNNHGDNYCLIGPYVNADIFAEFDLIKEKKSDPIANVVKQLQDMGIEAYYGRWLVTGRPKAVLLNPESVYDRLGDIKYMFWNDHNIEISGWDELLDKTLSFGYIVKLFFQKLTSLSSMKTTPVIGHFHEWMGGTCIPDIRKMNLPMKTVFTTHATLLGRYLAMNMPGFYDVLPNVDWEQEAKNFNVLPTVKIERAAAHGAHVFSTVSEVTARECRHLLGRNPDIILPNGLNIRKYEALHYLQNLHQKNKDEINQFVMGHFFQSYHFDLENTLYFFTSGRYEYKNKGFDLTLEALARLNYRLKQAKSPMTVVMFFITKQPYHSITPQTFQNKGVMEEVRQTCDEIAEDVRKQLFERATTTTDNQMPDLNELVSDYWKLRLRRTLQSWHTKTMPSITTHNLVDDSKDDILNFLRTADLVNHKDDRVKVVYHPDFISPANPLFGIEYGDFVRGCNLGVFPSYYEPWGYTPLECIASGVPAITSDYAGFGDYVLKNCPDSEKDGMYVVKRHHVNFDSAAEQLTDQMWEYANLQRRERIDIRNRSEMLSETFAWRNLTSFYEEAYKMALKR